ncbi:MAG TPA: hypothetical protein VJM47_02920 [Nitrosospira sp.]|jgi:hypothetical protein|nr:hypothetical protein [Nitrosospira sp.]
MDSKPINNTINIISSKELFTRINWLEQELNYRYSDAYSEELKALQAFAKNVDAAASVSTYNKGSNLIRSSYLEDYKKVMEGTSKEAARFAPVDFDGVIYWLQL